jgi:hypothetical protein
MDNTCGTSAAGANDAHSSGDRAPRHGVAQLAWRGAASGAPAHCVDLMTVSDEAFRILALCTQRPGQGLVDGRLSVAVADLSSHELLDAAEHHGLDALLFAHVRVSGLTSLDSTALDRLRARHVQQSYACVVRERVMAAVFLVKAILAEQRGHSNGAGDSSSSVKD